MLGTAIDSGYVSHGLHLYFQLPLGSKVGLNYKCNPFFLLSTEALSSIPSLFSQGKVDDCVNRLDNLGKIKTRATTTKNT